MLMNLFPAHLTQQLLILRLREELGIHADTDRVHAWIREGMPTAPRGGGKKPRFVWEHVRGWLLSVPPLAPKSEPAPFVVPPDLMKRIRARDREAVHPSV
jgi:hypothetical protein